MFEVNIFSRCFQLQPEEITGWRKIKKELNLLRKGEVCWKPTDQNIRWRRSRTALKKPRPARAKPRDLSVLPAQQRMKNFHQG